MLTEERRQEIEDIADGHDELISTTPETGWYLHAHGTGIIRELLAEIDRLNTYINLVDALRAKDHPEARPHRHTL